MESVQPFMATSRDAPNPLRPYYVPPSIGTPLDTSSANATSSSIGSKPASTSSFPSFGSSARDLLSDLDYGDYLGDRTPSAGAAVKSLLDKALWRYTSVLLAQPFEVAKTVLQVHLPREAEGVRIPGKGRERIRHQRYAEPRSEELPSETESDNDEPSYFTSTTPHLSSHQPSRSHSHSHSPHRHKRTPSRSSRSSHSRSLSPPPISPSTHSYKLELRRPDSVLEVLSQSWQKEAAWGVWKGTNATFIYSVLLKTIEVWTRSLLSALMNLPDPSLLAGTTAGVGGLDIIDSPAPLVSLGLSVAAAGVAGLLLFPLDLVRTRLVLTSTSQPPRALLPSLRSLPTWSCPPSLLPAALLHSTLPTLIMTSTPLFLRSYFRIDPILTPTTYSICTFLSATAELFLTLPFQTVLRRGQIHLLQQESDARPAPRSREVGPLTRSQQNLKTVVDVAPYRGIFGTVYSIVYEEGSRTTSIPATPAAAQRPKKQEVKKGQGIQGLWRGWRVGMWGLVGVWGAAAMGNAGGKGGEF